MEPIVVNDLMAKEGAWAVDQWLEEDHWSKNRHAADIYRARKGAAHPMCGYCFSRRCHDTDLIRGRKAFKKSKIINGPKRKRVHIYDASSDDEPVEPTPIVEPVEPADDRVV